MNDLIGFHGRVLFKRYNGTMNPWIEHIHKLKVSAETAKLTIIPNISFPSTVCPTCRVGGLHIGIFDPGTAEILAMVFGVDFAQADLHL